MSLGESRLRRPVPAPSCEQPTAGVPRNPPTTAGTVSVTSPSTRSGGLTDQGEPTGRDGRLVYDLARLPLDELISDTNAWVVARLTPDPCGYPENPDWKLNEDGKPEDVDLAANRRTQTRGMYGGGIEILSVLGRKPRCATRFEEITVPSGDRSHTWVSQSLYDVFVPPGGTVVCCVNEGYPGRFRYCPTLLIPPGWAEQVAAAARYAHEHPGAFKDKGDKEGRARLLKLAEDSNPYLAVAALKELAVTDHIRPAEVARLVAGADPVRQGAFTFLLLRQGPAESMEGRADALMSVVDKSKDFSTIRGIGLGVYVRSHTWFKDSPQTRFARSLAEHIVNRAEAMGVLSEVDRSLVSELRSTKLQVP